MALVDGMSPLRMFAHVISGAAWALHAVSVKSEATHFELVVNSIPPLPARFYDTFKRA